nr:immunoglobulin light chain junction region [Macaca mulatta]
DYYCSSYATPRTLLF